ncbi:hypothetical protein VSS74_07575 [Conexibacter stalactiti]|uniref:Uncharacterized protein n=1 Tax=Conexibacter stalactiti TaxID=1940611 RepID=A0ABU4HLM7_9ACTN|nr:hypothetical protein [Conexibacter stalactiti]MDW5594189.1 hypothetical protein [Conexibacter stalactiti]MEC5034831.1 hypothetical protein [Conexibacter stalactiti]
MSDADLVVGLDERTMNEVLARAYGQLYPKLFRGSEHVARSGLEFDVGWDVTAAPTVVLAQPPNGEQLVRDHLAQNFTPPPGISAEQVADAYVATLDGTTFQLVMRSVTFSIRGDGAEGSTNGTLTIFVQVDPSAGPIALRPLKAVGTVEHADDEWILNEVILPEAMRRAAEALAGVRPPALAFPGVPLTPPAVSVTRSHVLALANLAGKPTPVPPFADQWPAAPFFAVLSEEAKMAVARDGTRQIAGREFGDRGSVNIGIGTAKYAATARVERMDLSPGTPGSTEFGFNGPITGNVNAGIEIGCTTFGVNYTLYAKPDPNGRISLELYDGRKVRARTTRVETFTLLLRPDGSPLEWILSALTTPLLFSLTAIFTPAFTKLFEGISFDVWELPSIPVDFDDVHLVVRPSDVRFGAFAGRTTIEGSVEIATRGLVAAAAGEA